MHPREVCAALRVELVKWSKTQKTIDALSQLKDLRAIIENHIGLNSPGLKFFLCQSAEKDTVEVIFFNGRRVVASSCIRLEPKQKLLPARPASHKITIEEFIWDLICREAYRFKLCWFQRNHSCYIYFSKLIPSINEICGPALRHLEIPDRIMQTATEIHSSAIKHEKQLFSQLANFLFSSPEISMLFEEDTDEESFDWPLIDSEKMQIILNYREEGISKKLLINFKQFSRELSKRLVCQAIDGKSLH